MAFFRSRSIPIRRSLLGSVTLVIVLMGGAIMLTTFVGERQTVRILSRSLIAQTIEQTLERLHRFFDPVTQGLLMAQAWGERGLLETNDPEALNRLLVPVLRRYPQVSSLLIADDRGREHMLLRAEGRWRNRQTRRDQWGHRTRWVTWSEEHPTPVVSWEELDYDPRVRPWFHGAIEKRDAARLTALEDVRWLVHWTKPYTMFTTKDPGVTAAVTFDPGDGGTHVVGFDVLLTEISRFTTSLHVNEHGGVIVLTDEGRVIGLPREERYADPEARTAALLKRPDELGIGVVEDVVRAFSQRPAEDWGPLRFRSDGRPWWGEIRTFALAPERVLTVAVVVPESDLLGSLRGIRLGIVVVTLGVLAIALLQALFLARRYSRPIEALVGESDRISQGDLGRGAMVVSSVAEVQHLARAHDRMRLALRSLFKMERDLQLARQIQRSTWPAELPRLRGFDIAAWSEPAEETGGDTYDVIGLDASADGVVIVPAGPAPRAMLLLADAAGHGFGPALSVVQVRAMLRMAIRAGQDLPVIVQRMNAQLAADLTEGRFVTAWFGLLDARDQTLTSLACGQAPLIRYVASRQACELLDADTVPLGIFDAIETGGGSQRLDPGDVFTVCSDGIFEARGPTRGQFGPERVMELLRAHHTASAAEMLDALRKGVDAFTRGARADDDRTAIIIKRTP